MQVGSSTLLFLDISASTNSKKPAKALTAGLQPLECFAMLYTVKGLLHVLDYLLNV